MRYQSTEPLNRFYTSVPAPLLPYCLESVPIIQRPFLTPFAQYLGRISFSLYIVYVPIMFTFGRWVTEKSDEGVWESWVVLGFFSLEEGGGER
jgi:peptidoglycan/LPS O-acetylase OafA/YrhL